MKRKSKLLIGIVTALTSISIATLLYVDIAFSSDCENTIIKTSTNGSNEFVAVLFERNCGATTGFSTQVSIMHTGQELPNEGGNVYIADGYPEYNSLAWRDKNTLHIDGTDSNAYRRIEKIMGNKIIYE